MDPVSGYWAKNEDEDGGVEDPTASPRQWIVPSVQDRKNALLLQPTDVELSQAGLTTVQHGLLRGIEAVFQLEEGEILGEPMPTRDARTGFLFYEATEGGAGVLTRLVAEPERLAEVAREALAIMHFDVSGGLPEVTTALADVPDTISVFNGPPPEIRTLASQEDEIETAANWLAQRVASGVMPHEIGVFVRSAAQVHRARGAVERAGLKCRVLDEHVETASGHVSVGTMHLAKGLEFRAVGVIACDNEVIPLQERIQDIGDDADLQEVYDTERQLLYVACTRARDHLLVTSVEPGSEFLDDIEVPRVGVLKGSGAVPP